MKRAILKVTDCLLIELLKGLQDGPQRRFMVTKNPLPEDAKPVRVGHDGPGVLCILIESEKFDDVEKGKLYPDLPSPELTVFYEEE